MADIRTIEPGKYNSILAEALKKEEFFEAPEWLSFVKSSPHKQRPINEEDFWNKRAASILRQIYLRGVVGVNRLRTRYGGRKHRGVQPDRFTPASGKIIRLLLQQAESAGLVEKSKTSKAGRKLSEKGKTFLESMVKQ